MVNQSANRSRTQDPRQPAGWLSERPSPDRAGSVRLAFGCSPSTLLILPSNEVTVNCQIACPLRSGCLRWSSAVTPPSSPETPPEFRDRTAFERSALTARWSINRDLTEGRFGVSGIAVLADGTRRRSPLRCVRRKPVHIRPQASGRCEEPASTVLSGQRPQYRGEGIAPVVETHEGRVVALE